MKTNNNLAPLAYNSKSIRTADAGIDGLKLTNEWSAIESNVIENMRMMATRIRKSGEMPKMLSITSSLSGEGVTSICMGLGITMAHDYEAKTCIVDLNWYSPSTLYPTSDADCGVVDVIFGDVKVEDAIRPLGVERLYFLPAGKLESDKRPIAARSKALGAILQSVGSYFDHVILDLPAVLTTSDTVHMAAYAPACCLVVQQGVTPAHDIKMALDEINHLSILGVVLNRVDISTPDMLVKLLTE